MKVVNDQCPPPPQKNNSEYAIVLNITKSFRRYKEAVARIRTRVRRHVAAHKNTRYITDRENKL